MKFLLIALAALNLSAQTVLADHHEEGEAKSEIVRKTPPSKCSHCKDEKTQKQHKKHGHDKHPHDQHDHEAGGDGHQH